MRRSIGVVILLFGIVACERKTSPGSDPVAPDDAANKNSCSVDADCELELACGPCAFCPDHVPQAVNRSWQTTHCKAVRPKPGEPAAYCAPCPPRPDPLPEMPSGAACQAGQCVAVF